MLHDGWTLDGVDLLPEHVIVDSLARLLVDTLQVAEIGRLNDNHPDGKEGRGVPVNPAAPDILDGFEFLGRHVGPIAQRHVTLIAVEPGIGQHSDALSADEDAAGAERLVRVVNLLEEPESHHPALQNALQLVVLEGGVLEPALQDLLREVFEGRLEQQVGLELVQAVPFVLLVVVVLQLQHVLAPRGHLLDYEVLDPLFLNIVVCRQLPQHELTPGALVRYVQEVPVRVSFTHRELVPKMLQPLGSFRNCLIPHFKLRTI